nr:hypothetical protein TetV2_00558 [Oceanusvirus sp.]
MDAIGAVSVAAEHLDAMGRVDSAARLSSLCKVTRAKTPSRGRALWFRLWRSWRRWRSAPGSVAVVGEFWHKVGRADASGRKTTDITVDWGVGHITIESQIDGGAWSTDVSTTFPASAAVFVRIHDKASESWGHPVLCRARTSP